MNTSEAHIHKGNLKPIALALAILATSSNAFTAPASPAQSIQAQRSASAVIMSMRPQKNEGSAEQSRRSVLSSLLTTAAAATVGASVFAPTEAFAEAETMERGGVELTPFNSLAFNYRDGDSPTVDASTINEDSIPYSEFLEKLKRGSSDDGDSPTVDASTINEDSIPYSEFLEKLSVDQVTFVEFQAPNGDVAYATLKSSGEGGSTTENSKPIRIGEGYPVEDPKGWSSPAFVVKAVAKKGVPYKFVVPGLGDSFN
eukprot:CAMPEP_0172330926 /NCGR_PEP_ID=MMETSP1058-20130122/61659_1 /TAXON_ID=83371 /ORGANISM="Detonula confervacea, Strain CCMP 353" /LENGTH=256 /DNA_ID=CAMNT_0013048163 /DNA_START=41 /DNA_END=810 /DNA_ORIENTATION=-